MKGLFITAENGKSVKDMEGGISLKIRNQMQAFSKRGFQIKEFVMPFGYTASLMNKIRYRLPFSNIRPVWEYHEEFADADFIYLRRPNVMTKYLRSVLQNIKKANKKCKILMEIPTYPYDKELLHETFGFFMLFKDRYNRKRIKKLIDTYVTLSDDKELFGVSAIKISNGVQVDDIEKKKYIKDPDGVIHICAVAMFTRTHGYERVLYGLKDYYTSGGNRKIMLHFIGEGWELPLYKKIVAKERLGEHVRFHGYLSGNELSHIYNISEMALECFGLYKIKCAASSSLKSREAAARGIPIITGCKNDVFNCSNYKYILEFPGNDSAVDFEKIIEFRDTIYADQDGQEVVNYIRNQAYQMIDMRKCMENVFQYLINAESEMERGVINE